MDVLLALISVVGAFYFILLRPVMRQQRQRREDVSALDIGDEVLTNGGFYATVRDISTRDQGSVEISLEVAEGVILRATPEAVQAITRRATDIDGDDSKPVSNDADSS